jgi:hypothetical protein
VAWSLFRRQHSSERDEIEIQNPHPYRENKWLMQCDQGVTRCEPHTLHALSRVLDQETLWFVMKHGGGIDRRSRTNCGTASKCGDVQDGYIMSEVLISSKTSRYYFLKKRFLNSCDDVRLLFSPWFTSAFIFLLLLLCLSCHSLLLSRLLFLVFCLFVFSVLRWIIMRHCCDRGKVKVAL